LAAKSASPAAPISKHAASFSLRCMSLLLATPPL
jgi:hypothetical protein